MAKQQLPTQAEDFSSWYNEVVHKAGLADHTPVKGCMVIKPYGYAIWENIQQDLNPRIKASGAENAYFPLFIPKSLIDKEAEHVEGFAPELATITHVGNDKLDDPLVVRPTSETIMYAIFKDWIHSYRDLPLRINQWANVVRMEKRPRLFLRTTEFLWQEGHTCHATSEEAVEETLRGIVMYEDFMRDTLAVAGHVGYKSKSETFPGAVHTTTVESMSREMKAIQSCTSHFLGQSFSKSIGIQFQSKDNTLEHVWQTSWGMTTRVIGMLIVVHGDDKGLRLPPKVAPIQLVIVPIFRDEDGAKLVMAEVHKIQDALPGVRIKVDTRDNMGPGAKFYEWELKGVPLRLEIGPRDIEGGVCQMARRDLNEKSEYKLAEVAGQIPGLLEDIQTTMFEQSKAFLDANSHEVATYDAFKKVIIDGGFAFAYLCEEGDCEDKIKEETKAGTRCRPFGDKPEGGKCIYCEKDAARRYYFAKAY